MHAMLDVQEATLKVTKFFKLSSVELWLKLGWLDSVKDSKGRGSSPTQGLASAVHPKVHG